MGTRNLTMVHVNGEYKLAQYGQWDGYPDGQGKTILNFLLGLSPAEWVIFEEKCRALLPLTDEEAKHLDEELNLPNVKMEDTHPEYSRNTGGKILALIMSRPDGMKVSLDVDFAKDSLFCEWAYVIDLDKRTFEVYEGFNKSSLSEGDRFFDGDTTTSKEYYPVRLKKSYSLAELPTVEQFLADFVEAA